MRPSTRCARSASIISICRTRLRSCGTRCGRRALAVNRVDELQSRTPESPAEPGLSCALPNDLLPRAGVPWTHDSEGAAGRLDVDGQPLVVERRAGELSAAVVAGDALEAAEHHLVLAERQEPAVGREAMHAL